MSHIPGIQFAKAGTLTPIIMQPTVRIHPNNAKEPFSKQPSFQFSFHYWTGDNSLDRVLLTEYNLLK